MKKTLLTIVAMLLLGTTAFAQPLENLKKQQVVNALKGPHGTQIQTYVKKYSKQYNIDETLILAIIMTESGFNPKARSSQQCSGLMQMSPRTFKARGGTNIWDIEQQIKYGTKHYAGLVARYKGNNYKALGAYNYGGGRIALNKPLPAGAKKYVNKVYYHKKIIESVKQ